MQHGRLDVFCNNVGILGRQMRVAKRIMSFDAAEFDQVLRVNALGTTQGMKHTGRRAGHDLWRAWLGCSRNNGEDAQSQQAAALVHV